MIFKGDLNPNYDRKPKTDCYCINCQKAIKADASYFYALMRGDYFIPLAERHLTDDLVLLGAECAKKLPKHYRYKDNE